MQAPVQYFGWTRRPPSDQSYLNVAVSGQWPCRAVASPTGGLACEGAINTSERFASRQGLHGVIRGDESTPRPSKTVNRQFRPALPTRPGNT